MKIKEQAKDLAANSFWEKMVRLGYGVRGIIYFTIGYLALKLTLGIGGTLAGPNRAIQEIGQAPLGKIYILVILLGLVGYSSWGFIRAIFNPYNKEREELHRVGYIVSGISYGALIFPTWRLFQNLGNSSDQSEIFRKIFFQPWGKYLIAIIGLSWVIAGVNEFYIGLKAKFKEEFKIRQMTLLKRRLSINFGRIGRMSRGVVFALIGYLFFLGAYSFDLSKIKGVDGALGELTKFSWGQPVLIILSTGLIAFGIYSFLAAFWIRYLPKN